VQVEWKANDLTRGARESLEAAVGKPDVLVSCVGSVGFDVQGLLLGNAMANEAAAAAAAKVGTPRYVYCSVASEVAACEEGWLPGYFQVNPGCSLPLGTRLPTPGVQQWTSPRKQPVCPMLIPQG
jgi:hypothetical protein